MEMAKEEKSCYNQSLGTYDPKLGQRGVLQIPRGKEMLIPASVQANRYASHLPCQPSLQGGPYCRLTVPSVTSIRLGKQPSLIRSLQRVTSKHEFISYALTTSLKGLCTTHHLMPGSLAASA